VDRGDSHGEAGILAEQATVAEAAQADIRAFMRFNPSFRRRRAQVTPRMTCGLQNLIISGSTR